MSVFQRLGGKVHLKYVEDVSKNKQGTKGSQWSEKGGCSAWQSHKSRSLPSEDVLNLWGTLPKGSPSRYILPEANVQANHRLLVSRMPLGHNELEKTIKRLCNVAGSEGFFTNHSLWRTTATRLYFKGVDEQLIMERTGHSSVHGRGANYYTQKEGVSDLFISNSRPSKRCCVTIMKTLYLMWRLAWL